MGTRRTVVLLVAVLIAVVAGVATFAWLNGVQNRANKGARMVSVYVVKKDVVKALPAEQAINDKYIAKDQIQEKFRPATAITDLASIKGKVALTSLSANQVLVQGQFVDPRVEQITNSQRIPKGRVAVTVSIDSVKAVGGLLVPGDKVDMVVTDKSQNKSRLMYQNVEILFIGTSAAPQPGETSAVSNPGSGLITFSVPADAAERIIWASQGGGGIYLLLVPPDNQPTAVPAIGDAELFTGGLTPYQP